MFGGKEIKPDTAPEEAGIEDEQVSNSIEAVPVAYLSGERLVALSWISPVYNQKAKEAPLEVPGKK